MSNSRNIITRIEKLEARRRNDDEMLLIWRMPEEDADAAVLSANKGGLFGSGDLVLCAEWYGDLAPPAPRWIKRFEADVSAIESDYLLRNIEQIAGTNPRRNNHDREFIHLSDDRLMHAALGVAT